MSFLLYCFYSINIFHKPKFKIGDIVTLPYGCEFDEDITYTILAISKDKRHYKLNKHGIGITNSCVAHIDSDCKLK